MKVAFNYTLNHQVRMLDGQWQGVHLASDGLVYFFGGSHSAGVSAPFFRYDPKTKQVEMLSLSMTAICGEDPAKVPTQGKVHSDVLEHKGWLYVGTHLSDYSPAGRAAYTGGHLVGYEIATGRFRDFGVIHRNYTNYSAIGLDPIRDLIYFYATPFGKGDGPHLHRIEIAGGKNTDLGLIAPWKTEGHGQPAQHLFIDPAGDCWFTVRGEHALFVARGKTGKIERHDGVLPGNAEQWYCMRMLDADRVFAVFPDGMYIFDPRRGGATAASFSQLKPIQTPGLVWAYVAVDRARFYWNTRSQKPGADGRHETRIVSSSFANPQETVDHGPIMDADGRRPWFLGELVSDGKGKLYTAGRWYVLPNEVKEIGVDRHGLMVAVFFTVLDVSEDLR